METPSPEQGNNLPTPTDALMKELGQQLDRQLNDALSQARAESESKDATLRFLHGRLGQVTREWDAAKVQVEIQKDKTRHFETLHDQLKQRFVEMQQSHEQRFQDLRARAGELATRQKPYETLADAIGAELTRTQELPDDYDEDVEGPPSVGDYETRTFWTLPIYDANGEECERLELAEWLEKRKWCARELARIYRGPSEVDVGWQGLDFTQTTLKVGAPVLVVHGPNRGEHATVEDVRDGKLDDVQLYGVRFFSGGTALVCAEDCAVLVACDDPADDEPSPTAAKTWLDNLESNFDRMRKAVGLEASNPRELADAVVAGAKLGARGGQILAYLKSIEKSIENEQKNEARAVLNDLKEILLRDVGED